MDDLRARSTAAELSRKHGIPIHNILYWKQGEAKAVFGKTKESTVEEQVPVSEYKRALKEIKNLWRSLVNMTVDRDILKEAVDIALKKKWISLAK